MVRSRDPDRTCDYVASYILDRYLERDPLARVALEVQLKDANATVSGEVTSNCRFSEAELANFVREAVRKIGYTDAYRDTWGEGNVVSGNGIEVTLHISQQSGDIAQGVNRDGWGDQGIFWGMAVDEPKRGFMPKDYFLAREVATMLCKGRYGGLDIKTQVTVEEGLPTECVVAIPILPEHEPTALPCVESLAKSICGADCKVIVNGTGRYVKHGSIGDCGTTGRKLVCDFYGGNCRIGGGSPWGKDPTKADVSLNVLARVRALDFMRENNLDVAYCAISCCIGRSAIRVSFFKERGECLSTRVEDAPASHVIETLGLREPRYAERCMDGLFGSEE